MPDSATTAAFVPSADFSAWTLLVLLLVLAASMGVLWHLIRLYTRSRRRHRLRIWASSWSGRSTREVPPFLSGAETSFRVLVAFRSATSLVAHLRSDRTPASRNPHTASLWSVVAVRCDAPYTFAALRPESARVSLVDLYSISGARPAPSPESAVRLLSYPSLTAQGDTASAFTVFAQTDSDAQQLCRSDLATRLPPDLGLLLRDGWLVLDVSSRPFGELSLRQTLQLAQTLAQQPVRA